MSDEWYRETAINCFRYLDFKSFEQVDKLTLPEYDCLMEAQRLKEVDRDYRNHLQAFLNFAAQAKKKAGKYKEKPVYSTFKKFFNYEEAIRIARDNDQPGHDHRFDGIGATGLIKKKGE